MSRETLPKQPGLDLIKYRQASLGFLVLNIVWFVLFFWFLPPFNLGLYAWSTVVLYMLLIAVLAWFVNKGSRKLAIILAVVYGGRSMVSIYTIITGVAFTAVPYILPCHLLIFYLLGRAAWNWPGMKASCEHE